jgi:dolichol-phosphate mannosyltransferase
MKGVILIPTYNEKQNLEKLFEKIEIQDLDLDILIIDDNSPDGTADFSEILAKKNPHVKILRRFKKEGLGRAYQAGFEWALSKDYEIIFQMDADLSHDPNALGTFMREIQNADAVFGSRYLNGVRVYNWSFGRLLLSKLSNEFIRVALGISSTDTTTAYKCFRRKVIERIGLSRLTGKQNAFLIELVYWTFRLGFKTKEIPFLFIEREKGESKMRFSTALESLRITAMLCLLRLFPPPTNRTTSARKG